jgi:hypothetical protein
LSWSSKPGGADRQAEDDPAPELPRRGAVGAAQVLDELAVDVVGAHSEQGLSEHGEDLRS